MITPDREAQARLCGELCRLLESDPDATQALRGLVADLAQYLDRPWVAPHRERTADSNETAP